MQKKRKKKHDSRAKSHRHKDESSEMCDGQVKKNDSDEPLETQMLRTLDKLSQSLDNQANRHLSFFEGILPSIACFNESDTLNLQAGVVQLIRNIRVEQGYDSQPSHNSQPQILVYQDHAEQPTDFKQPN